jgi:hypothetical protein
MCQFKNLLLGESPLLRYRFCYQYLTSKCGSHNRAVLSASRLFLTYCNCQPLPLFHHETFFASLDARDIELQDAIQALAMRFSDGGTTDPNTEQRIRSRTESCRKRVMDRIANGTVELSTLQSLCLLSLIEHTGIVTSSSLIRTIFY